MTRRTGWCVAVGAVVLALTAAGCGAGEDSPQLSAVTPSPSVVVTGSPGGATSAPPGGGLGAEGDDGFAWIPFGPADASSPDGSGWYALLEERNCQGVYAAGSSLGGQDGDPLVLALAAVCQAAVENQQSQWAVARQQSTRPRVRPTTCLEQAGEALLARALAWHASHPGEQPLLEFPRAGEPTACEFEITKGSGLGPGSELPQGPVTGGTEIAITGKGINGVTAVFIGGKPAASFRKIDSAFVNGVQLFGVFAVIPPGAKVGPVDVAVRNRAGEAVAPLAFMYLAVTATPSAGPTPAARGLDPAARHGGDAPDSSDISWQFSR